MLRALLVFGALFAACSAIPLLSENGDMDLILLPQGKNGSMCLDGSPYGFYFSKATDPALASTYVLYFMGGGWCYNELDCLFRSMGSVGTSTVWGKTTSVGGLLSSDCRINPDFCGANRVYLAYCDGNSFSGMRDEPLVVNGKNLFFRGRFNIDAALDTLTTQFGMSSATDVLLTGCSAGGLATFLHADYVGEWLHSRIPSVKRYKAAPLSGFFLNHNNVDDQNIYPSEIAKIYEMSSAATGMNDACVKAKGKDAWQCNFAPVTYDYIKTPLYVINSAVDSWQTACILTAEPVVDEASSKANGNCSAVAGWNKCAGSLSACTKDQVLVFNGFGQELVGAMRMSPTYDKAGNGAFLYSCHQHCAAQSDYFASIAVDGITMQKALAKWWNAPTDAPASEHSHTPCLFTSSPPYQCNPTCGQ